jgi:myosin protein heavy chain
MCADAKKCAASFGVDVEPLLLAFCKPRVRVGTEWVNKGQNVEQVVTDQESCGHPHCR